MPVYRWLFSLSAACLLGLCWQGRAWAGCCLDGSRTFTNLSGTVILDTGDTQCAWHFSDCTLTVYSYVSCDEGPSTVVSFRVHPGANCTFYAMLCLAMPACGYVTTSEGQAYECTTTCE